MPAKGTELVESGDVIDMSMSVDDCVYRSELFPKGLLAKVWPSVEKESEPVDLQGDGGAGALVTRVLGGADGTVAPDDWNADGRARS